MASMFHCVSEQMYSKSDGGGVFRDIYHTPCCGYGNKSLTKSTKSRLILFQLFLIIFGSTDSLELVQRMTLLKILPVHKGCVNSVRWNSTGTVLLSGSDDKNLVITDAHKHRVVWRHKTNHKSNIFCAKFLPDGSDLNIMSCSGDGMVLHTGSVFLTLKVRSNFFLDINDPEYSEDNQYTCHFGPVYEVEISLTDPTCAMTCGEDGTVRWIDLRESRHRNCHKRGCRQVRFSVILQEYLK